MLSRPRSQFPYPHDSRQERCAADERQADQDRVPCPFCVPGGHGGALFGACLAGPGRPHADGQQQCQRDDEPCHTNEITHSGYPQSRNRTTVLLFISFIVHCLSDPDGDFRAAAPLAPLIGSPAHSRVSPCVRAWRWSSLGGRFTPAHVGYHRTGCAAGREDAVRAPRGRRRYAVYATLTLRPLAGT